MRSCSVSSEGARTELRSSGAVVRVEMAQANLGITRSDQFPQVSASGDVNVNRLSRNGAFPLPALSFRRRTEPGGRRS
jgi:outer membrane protein TolC